MNNALLSVDWSVLRHGTADDAAKKFLEILWTYLCAFNPYEKIEFRKRSHPWINERCEQAIKRKNAAEGTHQFQDMQKECASILSNEYQPYLLKLKKKIASLKKGSKEWWKLNRELLEKNKMLFDTTAS